jgi:hypothetical protein
MWPTANPGILCGDICVVDIDPRNDGLRSLARLQRHGSLPLTPCAVTGGGGWHFYFSNSAAMPTTHSRDYPGIDVQSYGTQIIAPPSLHRSGRRYSWAQDRSPENVPLAALPAWLVEVFCTRSDTSSLGDQRIGGLPLGRRARDFVAHGAPMGTQRIEAVAAARNFLSAGHSLEDTIAAIWDGLEQSPWDPIHPWTMQHVEKLVISVANSAPPPLRGLTPERTCP